MKVWVSGMAWIPGDAIMLYGTLHLGNGDNQNTAATEARVQVLGRDETAYLIQQQILEKRESIWKSFKVIEDPISASRPGSSLIGEPYRWVMKVSAACALRLVWLPPCQ